METSSRTRSRSLLRQVVGANKKQTVATASTAGKAQQKSTAPVIDSGTERRKISHRSLPVGDISSVHCMDTWAWWVEQSIAVEVAADGSYLYPADNLPERASWAIFLRITKLDGREISDSSLTRNATKDIEPGDLLHGSAHSLKAEGGFKMLPAFVVIERTQSHLRMIRGLGTDHVRFVLGRYNLWRVMTFIKAETPEVTDRVPANLSFNPQVVPANLFAHRLLRWADQPVFSGSSACSPTAILPSGVIGPEHQALLAWLSKSWPPADFRTMTQAVLDDVSGMPAIERRQITLWVRNLTQAFCRLRLVRSARANTDTDKGRALGDSAYKEALQ